MKCKASLRLYTQFEWWLRSFDLRSKPSKDLVSILNPKEMVHFRSLLYTTVTPLFDRTPLGSQFPLMLLDKVLPFLGSVLKSISLVSGAAP